jgi:hypothetical protein
MLYRPQPKTLASIFAALRARLAARLAANAQKRANLRYLEALSPHLQRDLGVRLSGRDLRPFN